MDTDEDVVYTMFDWCRTRGGEHENCRGEFQAVLFEKGRKTLGKVHKCSCKCHKE